MTSFERSSLMAQLIYQLQIKWAGNVKRRRTLGKEYEKEIRLNKIADPGFLVLLMYIGNSDKKER